MVRIAWTRQETRSNCVLSWLIALVLLTGGNHACMVAQEAPPAEDAAPKADAPPAAEGTGSNPTEEVRKRDNFLMYVYKASPVFFVIIGIISICLVSLITYGLLNYQLPKLIPPPVVAQVDALLKEEKFKEAYGVVKSNPSLFSRSLAAGVERLSHGFDRGVDAMVSVSEDGKMEMDHLISYISTIGALGPLIGLLGTVLGMIEAFQRIAQGGTPRPAEIAEAIGLALVTTLEGLVVALPAIFFYAMLRNRLIRIIFELQSLGEAYLWRFAAALAKKG